MININCKYCTNNCCKNLHLTPVLLSSEEESFKDSSEKSETPFKMMFLLKKLNGKCIFLDDKNKKCKIYDKRPFECRLYPFLLNFNSKEVDVKLDTRFCPHLETLEFNKEEILKFIKKFEFPEDWINGYESLKDC